MEDLFHDFDVTELGQSFKRIHLNLKLKLYNLNQIKYFGINKIIHQNTPRPSQ